MVTRQNDYPPVPLPILHQFQPELRDIVQVSYQFVNHSLQVGERLTRSLPFWELIHTDVWVLDVLRRGYKPLFLTNPLLTTSPKWFTVSHKKDPFLQKEIDDLFLKGTIEPVHNVTSPGFYTKIFLVPKKNGKLRPVIDLSPLNKFLVVPTFKMLTTRHLSRVLTHQGHAASLDLKDAYLHVPIRKSFRKYLRFAYRGRVCQFKSLPFGIATAPYVFTRIMSQLTRFLQPFTIPLHQFIDDWLTHALGRLHT